MPPKILPHPKLSPLKQLLTIVRTARHSKAQAMNMIADFIPQQKKWSHVAYITGVIAGAIMQARDPDALTTTITDICEQFIIRDGSDPDLPPIC